MPDSKTYELPTLKTILRLFYQHPLPGIPVVNHHLQLTGIIMRTRAMQTSSKPENLERSVAELLSQLIEHMSLEHFEELLPEAQRASEMPFIDSEGHIVRYGGLELLRKKPEESDSSPALLALDSMPSAMVMTDEIGTIKLVNRAFLTKFSLKAGEVIGEIITTVLPGIIGKASRRLEDKVHILAYKYFTWEYRAVSIENGLYSLFIFGETPASEMKPSSEEQLSDKQNRKKQRKIKVAVEFATDGSMSLQESLDTVESKIISEVFIQEEGNVSGAARVLGIPRQTLQYKLIKYKTEV